MEIVIVLTLFGVIELGANKMSSRASGSAPASRTGDTVDVGSRGDVAVTLKRVIDPAAATLHNSAPTDDHFVAVEVTIADEGARSLKDNPNRDLSIVGSDGQTYTTVNDGTSACSSFNEGPYNLTPGRRVAACVVFQVSDGVKPAKVRFDARRSLGGRTAEWTVQ